MTLNVLYVNNSQEDSSSHLQYHTSSGGNLLVQPSSTTFSGVTEEEQAYEELSQQLISISFCEGGKLLAVGTDVGYQIVTTSGSDTTYGKLDVKVKKDFSEEGGVGIVHILSMNKVTGSPSYLAIVGGGSVPVQPTNHCLFYDCEKHKLMGHLICASPILNIKSCCDGKIIIVILEDEIQIYRMQLDIGHHGSHGSFTKSSPSSPSPISSNTKNTSTLSSLHVNNWNKFKLELTLPTMQGNHRGLVAFTLESQNVFVLAYPSVKRGSVKVDRIQFPKELNSNDNTATSGQKMNPFCITKSTTFQAHNSSISCLGLSTNGSNCATASEKGTLIRVFSSHKGELIKEFKRGTYEQTIYSIAFSHDNVYVSCTSNSGTLHVFPMKEEEKQYTFLGYLLPTDNNRSIYKFKGIDGASICVFDEQSNKRIIVATSKGRLLILTFNDEKKEDPDILKYNYLL